MRISTALQRITTSELRDLGHKPYAWVKITGMTLPDSPPVPEVAEALHSPKSRRGEALQRTPNISALPLARRE
jgi:hypothetical protein